MVAIFTGVGAGFERGSRAAGALGLLGSSSLGRGGEGVFFNAANGNLLISHQDEFLVGRGPDVAISRTYNSLGALDDNGDYWRQNTDRRVFGLTGEVNSAGSTVRRVSADGSEIAYTWAGSFYQTTDGDGAHDRLTYTAPNGTYLNGAWTWTDGDSQITETYAEYGATSTNGGASRSITRQQDNDGNALAFTYTSGKLTRVTTQDGGHTDYTWSGSNIISIVTTYTNLASQTTATLTRTRYAYDGLNRLITVTADLSPTDNVISDGQIYTTSYTYDGTSRRVATISQTDGSQLAISYDGSGRVSQFVQTVASGDSRTTTIAYFSGRTEITDPRGQVTKLYYDAAGQLVQIVAPPAQTAAAAQTVQLDYSLAGHAALGSGLVQNGIAPPSGTPSEWAVSSGMLDGRMATSFTKPTAELWDGWWTTNGSVKLANGDLPDGSFSVKAGETVGYRFDGHSFQTSDTIISAIGFYDADGHLFDFDAWQWNDTPGWSRSSQITVAPEGTVRAVLHIWAAGGNTPLNAPIGAAIDLDSVVFSKLPPGAETVPPPDLHTPNLMQGGDLSLGASILHNGRPDGGNWTFGTATIDGAPAITAVASGGEEWDGAA